MGARSVRLIRWHPVLDQVVRRSLSSLGTTPGANAVLAVEATLDHRGTRQRRNQGGTAHMVGVEMRDEDLFDGLVEPLERRLPPVAHARQPETGIDQNPAPRCPREEVAVHMVDSERDREREAPDAFRKLGHERI